MSSLLKRFKKYVQVHTTAVEVTDEYPSSPGQWDLGKILKAELEEIGLQDVSVDEWGLVMGTIPGNVAGAPTICWLSHMDTSPEAPGEGVKPVVHENYDGGDIALPGDSSKVIRVQDHAELAALKGKTIITSDGTTLLGADDKAGIAVIMTTADYLMKNPDIKHGPIRVLFTCDEEVGRGADKVDIDKINAAVAYTLDGEGAGDLENETFSADLAVVKVIGYNIHPGLATGKMINAIRLASQFIARMPWEKMSPETTSGREQFMHPYTFKAGVDEAEIRIILRSFDSNDLPKQAAMLKDIAAGIEAEHPKAKVEVNTQKQYRNMAEALKKEPRAVELAAKAYQAAGIEPKFASIRGGTDGSRLSEMGLPTPNLSTGMHNFHSPLEFACLEEMESAHKVLIELAKLWGQEK